MSALVWDGFCGSSCDCTEKPSSVENPWVSTGHLCRENELRIYDSWIHCGPPRARVRPRCSLIETQIRRTREMKAAGLLPSRTLNLLGLGVGALSSLNVLLRPF